MPTQLLRAPARGDSPGAGVVRHGLPQTDTAFALEELDSEEKAEDSLCSGTRVAFVFVFGVNLAEECQPTL